jgi:hypothetical protein
VQAGTESLESVTLVIYGVEIFWQIDTRVVGCATERQHSENRAGLRHIQTGSL